MMDIEGERQKSARERLASEDCSVVSPFLVDSLMDDLFDKLKLLDYDTEYVQKLRMKPLNRHYFAIQSNPGEQFFAFTTLAAWLIRTLGRSFEPPQEYDDPNSTIAKILEVTKQLGSPVQCPPNKLKQGFGEHVIILLKSLADAAVKQINFKFEMPSVVEEVEELTEDEGAEIFLEKVEEEMYMNVSDDDEKTNMLELGSAHHPFQGGFANDAKRPNKILESDFTLDVDAWYNEVETVTPSLKYMSQSTKASWISNFSEMVSANKDLLSTFHDVKDLTLLLRTNISADIEKIINKENHTAIRVEEHLTQYKMLNQEAADAKKNYEAVSGGVKVRLKTLTNIHEQLESMKQEMDERGASMTDGSPLVSIKRAITDIKSDIKALDLRIGILEHNLLQARIRKKSQMQKEMTNAEMEKSPTNRAL